MEPLTARELLELWERAGTSRLARALAPLAMACPQLSWEQLLQLPLGHRDALLLELYGRSFGPHLDLQARCPACGERLELELAVADLLAGDPPPGPEPRELQAGELTLRFRLPGSEDVEAIAASSPEVAADLLLERCLLAAWRGEDEVEALTAADLDEQARTALASALAAADPRAELLLDLSCPACEHSWQALLEVADCLWYRLELAARGLLQEVHLLARGYGWREADVLALSSRRRRLYLEMLAR